MGRCRLLWVVLTCLWVVVDFYGSLFTFLWVAVDFYGSLLTCLLVVVDFYGSLFTPLWVVVDFYGLLFTSLWLVYIRSIVYVKLYHMVRHISINRKFDPKDLTVSIYLVNWLFLIV